MGTVLSVTVDFQEPGAFLSFCKYVSLHRRIDSFFGDLSTNTNDESRTQSVGSKSPKFLILNLTTSFRHRTSSSFHPKMYADAGMYAAHKPLYRAARRHDTKAQVISRERLCIFSLRGFNSEEKNSSLFTR